MSVKEKTYFEQVVHGERILAIVVRARHVALLGASQERFAFTTPPEFPFQMGVQNRRQGDVVPAHWHVPFTDVKHLPVQEMVYVVSGKVRVDLYDESGEEKVEETVLGAGDCILFNTGHGLYVLADGQWLVLKQGPYRGKDEEKRFVLH